MLRQPVGLLSDVRLRQLEERLNSGSEAAALLFLELRKAALQRMFQSIASEMGLEVRREPLFEFVTWCFLAKHQVSGFSVVAPILDTCTTSLWRLETWPLRRCLDSRGMLQSLL